jgi:hypothetical protein
MTGFYQGILFLHRVGVIAARGSFRTLVMLRNEPISCNNDDMRDRFLSQMNSP